MSTAYPNTLPVTEIRRLVDSIRTGKTADGKLLTKDAWEVVGYLLGHTVGEPSTAATAGNDASDQALPTIHEVVAILEKLAESKEADAILKELHVPGVARTAIEWTLKAILQVI